MTEKEEVKTEEVAEGAEEKTEETQTEPSSVNDAGEPHEEVKEEASEKLDPNLYDEFGVPWKNRAKEAERKRLDVLERVAFEKPKKDEPLFDENGDEKKEDIDQVLERRSSLERVAYDKAEEVIEGLARVNPGILKFKDAIHKELRSVKLEQRGDENLIRMAAMMKYGENVFRVKPDAPKKKIVPTKTGSDVLNPSQKGGTASEITLSPDEEAYAEQHRLRGKGFNNEDIRDLFKRASGSK
jgi:hypothetical protein